MKLYIRWIQVTNEIVIFLNQQLQNNNLNHLCKQVRCCHSRN
jgi:hypothetical protein